MRFKMKAENENIFLELPSSEKEIAEFCEKAGIANTAKTSAIVDEVIYNDQANAMFSGKEMNLDKLNYLAKRLDSLGNKELETFYAVSYGEQVDNLNDLINLTFNTHCASVVRDFYNLDKVGKEMYLTAEEAVSPRVLEELNGAKYLASVMAENPHPMVTPYGVVYKNSNPYEQVYDGIHFPQYAWEESIADITLEYKGNSEYLYLPCEPSEISKAMERLGVSDIKECEVLLESNLISDEIISVVDTEERYGLEQINNYNHLAKRIQEVGTKEMPFIKNLLIDLSPKTMKDLDAIFESSHEFELFDGIHTAEDYGRYMICESGHFEYDENLEEYIDFEKYGNHKIRFESGAFTDQGYMLYHGFNQDLSEMLLDVGIEIEQAETQTLKLYMPLRATSYYEENFYGDMEQCDDEIEIDSGELCRYEDEILDALKKYKVPQEEKRGLMEYYSKTDSVNAKVKRYDFSVEVVDGELMGVAVAELNAQLNESELHLLKESITGQASDGVGEGFEQRDIKCDGRDINVSFWNSSKNWKLQTAEELGIEDQAYTMEMRGM